MLDILLAALVLAGLVCSAAQARSTLTPEREIAAVFGGTRADRRTLFLTPEQAESVERLARVKLDSRIVSYYAGKGLTVFFGRAIVRTMPMTYAVVVAASGELDRVDVLSFEEPDDYLPAARWLQLYRGRRLTAGLAVGKDIPSMTGASLTSRAVNDGVRKALAVYSVCLRGSGA